MILQSPAATPVKMASTTTSVQNWLGQELETRGVDAVVYTRYILSIFQQDSFDLEQDPELVVSTQSVFPSASSHNQHTRMGHEFGGGGGGNTTHHSGTHHHHMLPARKEKGRGRCKGKNHHLRWQTPEDLKKDAVVKCLQSVAEKDCGIEGLVEELCLKLKKVQEERKECTTPTHSPDDQSQKSDGDAASQTERYYEAFPALSDKSGRAADTKPKGAWKSKAKRNNSTGSISNPSSDRESEPLPDKSVSASVSRNSHSPVGFQGKQYQRAQSLPSNLSRNQNKSPTFVVPKYQGRKGNLRTYVLQEKAVKRHQRDWDWAARGERIDGKYKNVAGRKKGGMFPEWFSESGEGQADLNLVLDSRDSGAREEAYQDVFGEATGDSSVQEEVRLEEAVNTMAETLCRSIIEECDDDKPFSDSATVHGLLSDQGDMYMFASGDNEKDWYAGSTRKGNFEGEVGMAPGDGDGQHCLLSSIWEKNLVPGSPLCEGQQEPWGNNARSCLPTSSSPTSPAIPSGIADANQAGSDPTSPRSQRGDSALEELSDATSLIEELRVDIDHHHLDSAPISPRNAPIGTGRNNDSLLRICDHTHAHSNLYDPQGPSTPGWAISSDNSQGHLQSTPGLPSDQSYSADDDSIVQSICSSQKDSSLLNISTEAHSLDMNNALWATYESKQPQVHPPKIVRWDESIFSGFQPMAKMSTFIEGGVYGSPYSSHNNSQFNSCSTSPCNDSNIRELWEGSHNRDTTSSVCSLECLLSPQPCGASCCSIQDEQSVIEDSLVDSPKYLCSRSSSRFDFARSDAENSDNSSAHGTETDEMISEDEWAEEVPRDVLESSKRDGKYAGDQSDNDRTPKDDAPAVNREGSLNSQQGSSANSQQGFFGSSLGSGKGTVVSQHLLSADWKKHEGTSPNRSPSTSLGGNVELASSERPFISDDSHFKPIQHEANPQNPYTTSNEIPEFRPSASVGYTRNSSFPGIPEYGNSSLLSGGNVSNHLKPIQGSAPQIYPYEKDSDQLFSNAFQDTTARSTSQTSQLPRGGLYSAGFGGSFAKTVPAPRYPAQFGEPGDLFGCTFPGGARADIRDPGGGQAGPRGEGGGGYTPNNWGFSGIRPPGMQLDPDSQFMFPEEDDTFLHEGLLVDQPLESHLNQRSQGRFKRRSGAKSVCKEFLEGCCTNSMCGYSHNTSHVTCGQWLEGRCERGTFCKFMHGYTSNMSSQNSSRAGSRTGSTDETEDTSWDQHHRAAFPIVPDLMGMPEYATGRSLAEGEGGEHMRSLPINISSKNR